MGNLDSGFYRPVSGCAVVRQAEVQLTEEIEQIVSFSGQKMSNEKFCLRWNDFENNISSAFRELRDDKDFFDVTLACEDEQIQAHKVILSACSPFFRNILRRNVHQHPLLYLKGVKYTDLQSVLNFMYHGEVNIAQEELNSFLAVAEDLRVKGLTQNQTGGSKGTPSPEFASRKSNQPPTRPPTRVPEREPPPPIKRPRPDPPPPVNYPSVGPDDDIQEVVQMPIKSEPRESQLVSSQPVPVYTTHQPVALQEQVEEQSIETYQEDNQVYEDYGQYEGDQQYGEADTSMPMQGYEAGKGGEPDRSILLENIKKEFINGKSCFVCTLCGKSNSQKSNLLKHVESVHFPTLFEYNCKYCGKSFGAKNNLYVHISNYHRENKTSYWF